MPQPTFQQQTDNRWLNRQVLRYGQRPLPVVGTIKPWVDLNDGVNLYTQSFDITDAKAMQIERQPWRAESVWMPEDFDPAIAKITLRIDETSGMTLQQARALMLIAGEQWLTFDNATGMLAKCRTFGTPKLIVNAAPYLWEADVEFIAREPWFQDLQPSGSQSNMLNPYGGFELATAGQLFWRSLGSDALGTLAYWNLNGATASITANVLTITTTGGILQGGHPDWQDITYAVRFQTPPVLGGVNPQPSALVHVQDANNWIRARVDGTTLYLDKNLVGVTTNGISTSAVSLVASTWYWIQVTCAGTTYSAKVFTDSPAGTMSASQVGATVSGTVSDATIQIGQVGLTSSTAGPTVYGGAFAGVCKVNGTGPTGWAPQTLGGEPAYAWSKVNPFSGVSSASIYTGATGGIGQWVGTTFTPAPGSLVYSVTVRQIGSGQAHIGDQINYDRANVTGSVPWKTIGAAFAVTGVALTPVLTLDSVTGGGGTVYYDSAVVQQALDATSGLYAQPLVDQISTPGGVGGTVTSVTVQYPGTVWAKPVWTFNIPASSNITQIKIQNATSGEVLTCNTVWGAGGNTMIVDANALSITDGASNQQDWTGSFPMLYPGANSIIVTITTSSGVAAVTLDTKWTNRWVL